MFRMEFQNLGAVEEDDEPSRTFRSEGGRGNSVFEQYRQKAMESRDSPPKVYEGRVGNYGKMLRIGSSNEAVRTVSHLPPVVTRSLSTNDTVPKNWVEVDLIDFGSPKAVVSEAGEAEAHVDQVVMRELVKPFADSVNLAQQPSTKLVESHVTLPVSQPGRRDLLSDGVEEVEAVEAVSASSPDFASLQVRTSSMRSTSSTSWSDSSDAEGSSLHGNSGEKVHFKDEERGSPATRAYNRAFNKIMHKKSKPTGQDAKFTKPWEEPLLATHDQVKLERKLQKEAKLEAKRLAEETKRDAENEQRELLELANPVPESALRNQKEHGVRKGIHKLFHIHGTIHSNQQLSKDGATVADARESKLVMPRASMFESVISPSSTDTALAQIRSGPRPVVKTDIQFATVESNQRDVQPWTMEEYMAKNARLPEWEGRVDDEEFGGIEGNQLLNQYFDDDAIDDFNSDSD